MVLEYYNVFIYAKHGEDPLTHLEYDLDLWLEARATSEPDRNQVYDISMTIAWDIRLSYGVSIIGTLKFNLSKPSLAIKELIEQWAGSLRAKIEAKYKEQQNKLEEIMAYFFNHYPPSYRLVRDFPSLPSPPATEACNWVI